MSDVGQKERITQNHVIKLFHDKLKYDYLGDWHERSNNRNIEKTYLKAFLKKKQGYNDILINKALQEFTKVAEDQSRSLYDINRDVYGLLRYGVKVKPEIGENHETIWLIDWGNPEHNDFAIAEEVTVKGENKKRPDIVLYINGIALGVLELKRSTEFVNKGIRQNLDNQKNIFIKPFFTTMQLVMAGNDTVGLRYGTIETPEKYYMTWKEPSTIENLLDRHLTQVCEKRRFLEILHDFIVFDAGIKKVCRPNQYFAVKAAQDFIRCREGGIIWHSQGAGKSLIMVWLAKWIRENLTDSRVLIITDRTELDEQIEKVFKGVSEDIYRTKSGRDLITKLNTSAPGLICSLVHKFSGKRNSKYVGDIGDYIEEMRQALYTDFTAKGDIYAFIDECHRTHSCESDNAMRRGRHNATGELHKAMKKILPNALFIGFTGTPLLKVDKKTSIEVFGRYIHTYKFDEAVADKVILDLRYEARDIDQNISSPDKIDQWFNAKTKGLNDVALAKLKQRWGTMRKVLSCKDRLEMIVSDILLDMERKPRLKNGHGNAILVSGSIYQACKFYELFDKTEFKGKCAIVTSYKPTLTDIKGEESGEGYTEKLRQYDIYKKMLGDYFNLPPDDAANKAEDFEKAVKKKFIEEPGQMKLLIVVDKLLTGFDAPPATYLYIDKQMHDHGLFQAICRVNRLDGDDKEYGYIIDYKDLFRSLEKAVNDYTSEAFAGYDKSDVEGLLNNRLEKARERLEEALEAVKALCEDVAPKDTQGFIHYFCAKDPGDKDQLKDNESKRITLYKLTTALVYAYAELANELEEAGYTADEIARIKRDVDYYEKLRTEIKIASGDYIDLKLYEPAMRHLIDTYIRAEDSKKISAFDDLSLIQLIVERGPEVVDCLPTGIRTNKETVAETIVNNLRKVIIDEQPINPMYYEEMSRLLDALIKERKEKALEYEAYLAKIVELTKKVQNPTSGTSYPPSLNTAGKRALYDNLSKNEGLAITLDTEIRKIKKDDWRNSKIKEKEVRIAIGKHLKDEKLINEILELVKKQQEY